MAGDVFLKLEGIKGESEDHKHKGEIEITSWSWGAHNHGHGHAGTGLGSGKVEVQDVTLTKHMDVASPDLMKFCCTGKHIGTATLTCRKAGGEAVEYLTIELKDVLISNFSMSGSGHAVPSEHLTLHFAKVHMKYTQQNEKGAKLATPEMKWDITKNKEA